MPLKITKKKKEQEFEEPPVPKPEVESEEYEVKEVVESVRQVLTLKGSEDEVSPLGLLVDMEKRLTKIEEELFNK